VIPTGCGLQRPVTGFFDLSDPSDLSDRSDRSGLALFILHPSSFILIP